MADYALVLRLDLSEQAPEGPGWYVYATGPGGENDRGQLIAKPSRVAGRQAMSIAQLMQQGLSQGDANLLQVVQSGNGQVRQHIEAQIAFAEKQAQRIGALRRALQAESDTVGE